MPRAPDLRAERRAERRERERPLCAQARREAIRAAREQRNSGPPSPAAPNRPTKLKGRADERTERMAGDATVFRGPGHAAQRAHCSAERKRSPNDAPLVRIHNSFFTVWTPRERSQRRARAACFWPHQSAPVAGGAEPSPAHPTRVRPGRDLNRSTSDAKRGERTSRPPLASWAGKFSRSDSSSGWARTVSAPLAGTVRAPSFLRRSVGRRLPGGFAVSSHASVRGNLFLALLDLRVAHREPGD